MPGRHRLARVGGTVDPGGQMDMQQLLAAAQQMQEQLMTAQEELAEAEVEGTAGGGLVTARVNGQGELVDLVIAPAAIDPADPAETAQTVADLVLAAIRDANRAAGDLQQQKMGRWPARSAGWAAGWACRAAGRACRAEPRAQARARDRSPGRAPD